MPISVTGKQLLFRENFEFPAELSFIFTNVSGSAAISYGSKKTNPNVSLVGADEQYLLTAGYEIERGRNFTPNDLEMSRHLVIVGRELARNLFDRAKILLERSLPSEAENTG
jgi:putative ABC transport system permease protein